MNFTMNIKSATKFGLVGAIINIIIFAFFILLNAEIITLVDESWDYEKQNQVNKTFYSIVNALQMLSSLSLAVFFYVLCKNQK